MNHYYTKNNDELDSSEKDIFFKIKEKSFHFITDNGVFSKSGLDFGSRLLIESVIDSKRNRVLDLGTGYGVIGITYKLFNPEAKVFMTDINQRATNLAQKNAQLNKVEVTVVNGDGFEYVNQAFDLIITNPPIRTGKENIYRFFKESFKHLAENGELYFVMHKKHGVLSAIKKCEEIFNKVEIISKKSGYHIVRSRK